jgi:Zn-dependent protease with chaperone function
VSLLLLGLGLVLLALPGVLGTSGARLAPREWGRTTQACLRMGRLAIHAGLAFAALPAALAAAGAQGLAHACHPLAAGDLPLPLPVGGVAGLVLVVSTGRGVAARRRKAAALVRLRVEPWLGRHRVVDGVDVVTLPCAERVAYAVPGRPAQVVVSDGLLAGLDPDETEAVLRHERAHLHHRHHDALALAADIEMRLGWFPPARASAAVLRLAIERWADEDAGAASAAARPAVRTALLKTVGLMPTNPVPAFTDACHEHPADGAGEHSAQPHAHGTSASGPGATITIEPGGTGDLTYTFAAGEEIEIGCHERGHYAAGMRLAITVVDP